MHCIHLQLEAEYWNFGKEPSDKTPLRKQIARVNGKIMIHADFPDIVVVALKTKKQAKELANLVGGFYIVNDVTNNLNKEGLKMLRDTLKEK
jgi:hypothetical protein